MTEPLIHHRRFHARFGGVHWHADLPLDGFDAVSATVPPADAIAVDRLDAMPRSRGGRRVGRTEIDASGVRFCWDDEACFVLQGGCHIGWHPGPCWTGTLPPGFYSSMAAIAMAWRGLVPLHASAVVLHDHAWLLAGAAGAGKSTLAADLVAAGAQFLADDLTVVSATGQAARAWRGRPAMRLHPATAATLAQRCPSRPAGDGRGKLLAWPAARAADQAWPIGGLLLLDATAPCAPAGPAVVQAVAATLFRPRIVTALPDRPRLHRALVDLARQVPLACLPPAARAERTAAAVAAIARLSRR